MISDNVHYVGVTAHNANTSAMSRKTRHTIPVIGELMRIVCGPLHSPRGQSQIPDSIVRIQFLLAINLPNDVPIVALTFFKYWHRDELFWWNIWVEFDFNSKSIISFLLPFYSYNLIVSFASFPIFIWCFVRYEFHAIEWKMLILFLKRYHYPHMI